MPNTGCKFQFVLREDVKTGVLAMILWLEPFSENGGDPGPDLWTAPV